MRLKLDPIEKVLPWLENRPDTGTKSYIVCLPLPHIWAIVFFLCNLHVVWCWTSLEKYFCFQKISTLEMRSDTEDEIILWWIVHKIYGNICLGLFHIMLFIIVGYSQSMSIAVFFLSVSLYCNKHFSLIYSDLTYLNLLTSSLGQFD